MSETAVWQARLSEVRQHIVPDRKSNCIENSVTEVGARLTDEKRTSVSRVQSSWASVGDEAAFVSHRVQTTPDGRRWRPWTRRAAALEASAVGREMARRGCIAEYPSTTERQRSTSTGGSTSRSWWWCRSINPIKSVAVYTSISLLFVRCKHNKH